MSRKKRRILPTFLAIVVIVLVVLGVMVKWNSNYKEEVSGNLDVYNKFKNAIMTGGTISFSSDDINSIIASSFKAGEQHSGVTIKNIYVDLLKDSMDVKIPVQYKGISLLVSSTGKLSLKDGGILYTPSEFKVGALPIPKNLVLNKLKAASINKFTVLDDGIYITKEQIPVTINSIDIQASKLNIGVNKLSININDSQLSKVRDELKNVMKNLNGSDKTIVEQAINFINNNPSANNVLNDVKNKLSGASNSEVKKIVNDISNNNSNKNSNGSSNVNTNTGVKKLDSATASGLSKDLGTAAAHVSDAAGRAVVYAMQAQAASGSINTSAILPQYKALSDKQRAEVKSAVLNHVSPMYFVQIQNMFR